MTAKKKEIIIKQLAKHGNITTAMKAAKLSRQTYYNYREADLEFAAAADEAFLKFVDSLEKEVDRRAFKGVLKPVYQGGKMVGKVREYSDTLAIFRLKALAPERYRERSENRISGDLKIQEVPEEKLESRIAQLLGKAGIDSEAGREDKAGGEK